MMIGSINDIKQQFRAQYSKGLPGRESLFKMAALKRSMIDIPVPPSAKESAVMEIIFPDKENNWHIVFIQRVTHEKDRHSGQIGFPGGRKEISDADLLETAIRECQEEVGVDIPEQAIIGAMTPFYIPVSGYYVQPYLSVLDTAPSFILQESEVSRVLTIPLEHLMDQSIKGIINQKVSGGMNIIKVPYYDLYGDVLWGATAMFSSELIDLLQQ